MGYIPMMLSINCNNSKTEQFERNWLRQILFVEQEQQKGEAVLFVCIKQKEVRK